eukprot:g49572.t1
MSLTLAGKHAAKVTLDDFAQLGNVAKTFLVGCEFHFKRIVERETGPGHQTKFMASGPGGESRVRIHS